MLRVRGMHVAWLSFRLVVAVREESITAPLLHAAADNGHIKDSWIVSIATGVPCYPNWSNITSDGSLDYGQVFRVTEERYDGNEDLYGLVPGKGWVRIGVSVLNIWTVPAFWTVIHDGLEPVPRWMGSTSGEKLNHGTTFQVTDVRYEGNPYGWVPNYGWIPIGKSAWNMATDLTDLLEHPLGNIPRTWIVVNPRGTKCYPSWESNEHNGQLKYGEVFRVTDWRVYVEKGRSNQETYFGLSDKGWIAIGLSTWNVWTMPASWAVTGARGTYYYPDWRSKSSSVLKRGITFTVTDVRYDGPAWGYVKAKGWILLGENIRTREFWTLPSQKLHMESIVGAGEDQVNGEYLLLKGKPKFGHGSFWYKQALGKHRIYFYREFDGHPDGWYIDSEEKSQYALYFAPGNADGIPQKGWTIAQGKFSVNGTRGPEPHIE